jgi:hypothetical protein
LRPTLPCRPDEPFSISDRICLACWLVAVCFLVPTIDALTELLKKEGLNGVWILRGILMLYVRQDRMCSTYTEVTVVRSWLRGRSRYRSWWQWSCDGLLGQRHLVKGTRRKCFSACFFNVLSKN